MKATLCLVTVLLVLGAALGVKEHAHHHASHLNEDGEHNPSFDHESILGSEDLEEEFDNLPPEQARERLAVMAAQHDLDKDGHISKAEMLQWITNSFLSLDKEEAMEKFEEEDEDKDGSVTWDEYVRKVYSFDGQEIVDMRKHMSEDPKSEEGKQSAESLKMLDDDKKMFDGADENKDGKLDAAEYEAFFYPQNFPRMFPFELERYLGENDKDGDGKITLAEFTPEGAEAESAITSKENFKDLDKDSDGSLTGEEMRGWLMPGQDDLAEEEADHLIEMADENKDGRLSLEEILDRTEEFVGSSATDYGNMLRHEEL